MENVMPATVKIRALYATAALLLCVNPGFAQTPATDQAQETIPLNKTRPAFIEHKIRGDILMQQNDIEGAIAEYSASIGLSPFKDSYQKRARAYELLGRLDDAIRDYTAAINNVLDAFMPNWPAFEARGQLYMKQKMYDRAIEDFSQAIALSNKGNDELIRSYNDRTAAYVLNHQPDLGFRDADAAVRIVDTEGRLINQMNLAISYNNRARTRFLQAQNIKDADRQLAQLNAAEADANKAIEIANRFDGGASSFPRFFNNRADNSVAQAELLLAKAEAGSAQTAQLKNAAQYYLDLAANDFEKVLAKAPAPNIDDVARARAGNAIVKDLRSRLQPVSGPSETLRR
jgi:tetratricopeptide (TPR) repeat protein